MSKPNFEVFYVASYPRSGNTLVRSILWNCFGLRSVSRYDEKSTLLANREIANMIGACPAPDGRTGAHSLIAKQGIVPYKVHDVSAATDDMPAIYIIRDGREVMCSNFEIQARWVKDGIVTMEEVILGQVQFGGWSDHIKAWNVFDRPRTLLLRYEDVMKDIGRNAERIGAFIGMEPIKKSIPSFESHKSALPGFFRSGTNTTWRELLTGRMLKLFYELHGDMAAALGYVAPHCAEVTR